MLKNLSNSEHFIQINHFEFQEFIAEQPVWGSSIPPKKLDFTLGSSEEASLLLNWFEFSLLLIKPHIQPVLIEKHTYSVKTPKNAAHVHLMKINTYISPSTDWTNLVESESNRQITTKTQPYQVNKLK